MKTCKEIYTEHRRQLDALYTDFQARMNEAATEEFPPGTEVMWDMPNNKPVKGKVTGHVAGETASIMVRSNGGIADIVRAWKLTPVTD